jgi:hypothetical protein
MEKREMFWKNKLNQAQLNFLLATLDTFEAALRQSRAAIDPPASSGILSNPDYDIPPHHRDQIKSLIDSALTDVGRVSGFLGMEKGKLKTSNRIVSLMSAGWVHLMEVREKRLLAYGKLDEATAQEITETFAKLASLAREIEKTSKENSTSRS